MEKAIKKAIEGGYKFSEEDWKWKQVAYNRVCLDPKFWQALGKACPIKCWACKGTKYFPPDVFHPEPNTRECGNCDMTGIQDRNWKQDWYNFIDHLAQGKLINDFFDDILK